MGFALLASVLLSVPLLPSVQADPIDCDLTALAPAGGGLVGWDSTGQCYWTPMDGVSGQQSGVDMKVTPEIANGRVYLFLLFPEDPSPMTNVKVVHVGDGYDSGPLPLQGRGGWRGGLISDLAYWDPPPGLPDRNDYEAQLEWFLPGGSWGLLTKQFALDRTAPELAIQRSISGRVATVDVSSSEPLSQRDFQARPVHFRPGSGSYVWLAEFVVTTDLAARGKRLYAVWQECVSETPYCEFEVMFAESDDYGKSWGLAERLTYDGFTGGKSRAPTVAVGDNYVYVFFQGHGHPGGVGELYFMRRPLGGGAWDAPRRLTFSGASGSTGDWPFIFPSAAASGRSVHVVWEDRRGAGTDIYYLRSLSDGDVGTWEYKVECGSDCTRRITDAGSAWLPNAAIAGDLLTVTFLDARDDPPYSEAYATMSPNARDVNQIWHDGGGDPNSPLRRLTLDRATACSIGWPRLDAYGRTMHVEFGHQTTAFPGCPGPANPDPHSATYLRSMDAGFQWEGGGVSPYRVLEAGQGPLGNIYGGSAAESGYVGAVWWDWGAAPIQLEGKFSTDSGNAWSDPVTLTDPQWGFLGVAGQIAEGAATDPLGGHHVVWMDMFSRHRLLYYSVVTVPTARVTAPNGQVTLVPLSGSGLDWSLPLTLDQAGLYTVEIGAYDKAGNFARKVTYVGSAEFAAAGDKTYTIALDEDASFAESLMGLSSLADFSERTGQTDQLNDAVLDLFAYLYFQGHRQGQSFTPASTRLTGADLLLSRTAGFTSDLIVEVQSEAGGLPSGEVLASALIPNANVPTTPTWIHVDFPPILTSGNVRYDLIARAADPLPDCVWPDPCEQFAWEHSGDTTDDVYVRGNSLWYFGSAWSAGGPDRRFKTWTNAIGPEYVDEENVADVWPFQVGTLDGDPKGQRFTPAAHTIARVDVRIQRSPDFPADLWVEVVNNGPGDMPDTSSPVARAYLQNEDVPTSMTWTPVDFANAVVTPGEKYHIVVRPSGTYTCPPPPPYSCYFLWDTSTDLYAGGEASKFVGGSWQPSGGDRMFKVYAVDPDGDSTDQTTGSFSDTLGTMIWGAAPVAQGFRPSSAVLSRIDLYLSRSADLNWNLLVRVVRDDGTGLPSESPADLLARKVLVPGTTLGTILTTPSWVPVYLEDLRVTPSETYHVIAEPTSGGALEFEGSVSWPVDTLDEYSRGRASTKATGIWQPVDAWDRLFASYASDRSAEADDQELDIDAIPFVSRVLDGTTPALAQGFTPTAEVLSSATMILGRSDPLETDLLVELRGSLPDGSPDDLDVKTRVRLPAESILVGPDYVTVDFSDYRVESPGEPLHLVLTSRTPLPPGQYVQWFLHYAANYYVPGSAWSYGGAWAALQGDFAFRVRGMDTTPVAEDQSQLASNAYVSLDPATPWAQSFRPSRPILTGADLVLYQTAPFPGGIEVEVQDSVGDLPSGVALARTFVHSGFLPPTPQPVSVALPDLVVDPASDYFLVVRRSGTGEVRWQYHEALSDAQRDAYALGTMVEGTGATGIVRLLDDLAFRTHGKAYARVVTAPYVQIAPDQSGPNIWPIPPLSGEFYGPTATDDFTVWLNFYVPRYFPDEFGYVHIQFLFHSASAGNLLLWAERLKPA